MLEVMLSIIKPYRLPDSVTCLPSSCILLAAVSVQVPYTGFEVKALTGLIISITNFSSDERGHLQHAIEQVRADCSAYFGWQGSQQTQQSGVLGETGDGLSNNQ